MRGAAMQAQTWTGRHLGIAQGSFSITRQPQTNFRKYYDVGLPDLDVFGIAVNEVRDLGSHQDQLSIAASRFEKRSLDREIILKRFISDSKDVIEAQQKIETASIVTTDMQNDLRRALRHARCHAEKSLDSTEKDIAAREMNADELRKRIEKL